MGSPAKTAPSPAGGPSAPAKSRRAEGATAGASPSVRAEAEATRQRARREEAGAITNAQAIERLPAERQASAWAALDAFCVAFNQGFVLVDNLFECQANPFLYTEEGTGTVRVDLSGSGGVAPVCTKRPRADTSSTKPLKLSPCMRSSQVIRR